MSAHLNRPGSEAPRITRVTTSLQALQATGLPLGESVWDFHVPVGFHFLSHF